MSEQTQTIDSGSTLWDDLTRVLIAHGIEDTLLSITLVAADDNQPTGDSAVVPSDEPTDGSTVAPGDEPTDDSTVGPRRRYFYINPATKRCQVYYQPMPYTPCRRPQSPDNAE